MDSNQETKDAILFEALQRSDPDDREAYLQSACGSNAPLRADIDSLLSAFEGDDGVLDVPQGLFETANNDTSEAPGTLIDRYRLAEKMGEGGMATVYRAEQERPIRREVALKIIKLGMDTRQVIARFEAERQALALMNHPNIAQVFDAGATETGRPYFVMELVDGVSFTAYCDQNGLETAQRLELFVEVCGGVTHAHERGIIHRDIKPSNVLIVQRESKPVPKVIDFGIAKAINVRLTERTLCTRDAQIVGTPEYMSPEQATLGDNVIDARTDVYSLGVLLYELLTGSNPYQDTQLRDASYSEICRIIRETEPLRPSSRVKQMRANAKPENRKPKTDLATELDWITMKALDKEPERRYQTVAALAADIERHLRHEPVQAGPPGILYRLSKLLRRHRIRATSGLLLASALLMGATAATLRVFYLRPTGTGAHAAGMVQRHIWNVPGNIDLGSTLSLDGRYLPCVGGDAGNLVLRDLIGNTSRLLTSNTDWETLEGWAQDSAISGDGQWIAYNWFLEGDDFYDLRVIDRNGIDMRILYHDPNTFMIVPYAWSPDDQAVLAYISDIEQDLIDERTQERYRRGRLVLVHVTDGSVTVLQEWERRAFPRRAVFSPDGNRIAYDFLQRESGSGSEYDIFVHDLRTGQTSTPVAHPADDQIFGWIPGQDRLLFQSHRNASRGLWMVTLDDASPESSPILLKRESPGRPVGFTQDGSFYYSVSTGANDVYLAQLDATGLNFVEKPQLVSTRAVGSTSVGVWSPDGKILAHRVGQNGTRASVMGSVNVVFSLYSPQTGQARLLAPDPPFRAGSNMRGPQFSPDGNTLLVYSGGPDHKGGVYEIDCQTGQTSLLWTSADRIVVWPLWSPDGRVIYIAGPLGLIQYNPVTQEEKTLYSAPTGRIVVSADGQWLAFWRDRSSLVILPVSGGPPREVLRLEGDVLGNYHAVVTWMPDNEHLLFSKIGRELWRVNIQTGQQRQVGGPLQDLAQVDVHPDGSHLAFTLEQHGSQLWVMEGFLPEP